MEMNVTELWRLGMPYPPKINGLILIFILLIVALILIVYHTHRAAMHREVVSVG